MCRCSKHRFTIFNRREPEAWGGGREKEEKRGRIGARAASYIALRRQLPREEWHRKCDSGIKEYGIRTGSLGDPARGVGVLVHVHKEGGFVDREGGGKPRGLAGGTVAPIHLNK